MAGAVRRSGKFRTDAIAMSFKGGCGWASAASLKFSRFNPDPRACGQGVHPLRNKIQEERGPLPSLIRLTLEIYKPFNERADAIDDRRGPQRALVSDRGPGRRLLPSTESSVRRSSCYAGETDGFLISSTRLERSAAP